MIQVDSDLCGRHPSYPLPSMSLEPGPGLDYSVCSSYDITCHYGFDLFSLDILIYGNSLITITNLSCKLNVRGEKRCC